MNLREIFSTKHILVIGDSMLDHYIYGNVYRVSPEAPVPVVLKKEETYSLGGAANVAQNITSLGAKCTLISVVGNDNAAKKLRELSLGSNMDSILLPDSSRPTTVKTRVIGNNHQIVRIDNESTHEISVALENSIMSKIHLYANNIDGVIISDYGKGLLTKSLLGEIYEYFNRKRIFTLTDPKDMDFSKYSGTSVIKPNITELKVSLGLPLDKSLNAHELVSYMEDARNLTGGASMLLTLSEDGILYSGSRNIREAGIPTKIADVSGAGDTVSAAFTLARLAGVSLEDQVSIANYAASLVCQVPMTVPVDTVKLFDKFTS